ncbi:hypothetical protein BKA66DRAFT_568923 [Pyrenochaeta sp. MPI-SDFR-AT-0127]|nr:hypothetical protein BKA66DRAFT_568923 [Pyrenochaeta sp. MPI-SDFR-AT-0127]
MSPAHGIQRRMIIRQTWQKLFSDPSLWTTRFVVSRSTNPTWQALVDAENETYGDIIQLSHLEENSHVANTVKTIEFFKYLTRMETNTETETSVLPGFQTKKWSFVSKIDDDSFLDAKSFYHNYLLPLQNGTRTIIARTIHMPNYTVPGGQFYTMTSDMVSLLANLHTDNPIADEAEDVLVGRLLYEANQDWLHIDLPNPIAFDYEATDLREEGKAFAAEDADLSGWRHAVGPEAINPHKLRDDETYIKVAACFDKEGVIV